MTDTTVHGYWINGTTTYTRDGRAFIARNSEGFNLFTCAKPFGVGSLAGTFATMAAAKAAV